MVIENQAVHFRRDGLSYCGTEGFIYGIVPLSLSVWEFASLEVNAIFKHNYHRCTACLAKAKLEIEAKNG